MHLVNGMGSKAVSLAPLLTQEMSEYLINNTPLYPEVEYTTILVGAFTYYFRIAKYTLLLFAVAKLYFLLVNMASFEDVLSFPEIWWNGIRLDLSILGYVMVLPLLIRLLALVLPSFFGYCLVNLLVAYLAIYYSSSSRRSLFF